MDFRCKNEGCFSKGFWECTCPKSLRFCDVHIMGHSKFKGCSNKYSQELYQNFINKGREYENIFSLLRSDCINQSQLMITEIINYLNKQLAYLKEKKHIIEQSFLSGLDITDSLDSLRTESKILTRDRSFFTISFKKLLCVNIDSLPTIAQTEKTEYELHTIKKELKKTLEKLGDTESELRSIKRENESREKQSEENGLHKTISIIDETRRTLRSCTALSESQIQGHTKNIENCYKEMRKLEMQNKQLILNIDALKRNIESNETQSREGRIAKNLPKNDWKSIIILETFNLINTNQQVNFLVQNNYQNFKNHVVNLGLRVKYVKLTNDEDYIFVCKTQADCKNY